MAINSSNDPDAPPALLRIITLIVLSFPASSIVFANSFKICPGRALL